MTTVPPSPAPDSQAPARSAWNPDQYARFHDERSQPFLDLMGLVRPRPDMRVVDLGCGPGEMTRVLHQHLQARETVGLDSSDPMLAKTGAYAGDGLRFEKRDIRSFPAEGEQYDLVFSNAALQWVLNHETLIPQLASGVAAGGQFAVQMPFSHEQIAHHVAHEIAAESPFREELQGYIRPVPVMDIEWYANLLDRLGFAEQHVRMQVYPHHLESREGVIEWVKGSLLTDYERRLSAELYAEFLTRYRERLLPQLEDTHPFFYPFKRVLFWAQR
jgi:trans-aconitate 2-methyltransferase